MMLSSLSDYLQARHRASLADMALALDSTPAALEPMLTLLQRKGRVRRLPEPARGCCGSNTCSCGPADLAVYEWLGAADAGRAD